jgi:virginiamycin B lyase
MNLKQASRLRRTVVATAILSSVALWGSPAVAAQRIQETAVPTPNANPVGITQGPGGMWFTESSAASVGVLHRDGSIREFQLTAGSSPQQIVTGPDGNLWITLFGANAIGRMTPRGQLTTFRLPRSDSGPFGIAVGPDGNLWFTETQRSIIGKITPTGTLTQFQLNLGFNPEGITAGPDGAMWFTRFANPEKGEPGFIGRITTAGAVTQHASDGVLNPLGIATGADGNLWVTGASDDVVAKVTTDFEITPFPIPGSTFNTPNQIAAGPDGALWFTEFGLGSSLDNTGGNKIGRITVDGAIRQFKIPTVSSGPAGIAPGAHGTIWFTEQLGDKLGHLAARG